MKDRSFVLQLLCGSFSLVAAASSLPHHRELTERVEEIAMCVILGNEEGVVSIASVAVYHY